MRNIILFILALVICGCSIYQKSILSKNTSLKPIVSEEIKHKMNEGQSVYLQLGVIPGAIYGAPQKEPEWYIDLNENLNPTLDFERLELELLKIAKPQDASLTYSLKIEPVYTKLVRVSTFGYDKKSKTLLSGRLSDESNNAILLVYFDRACTVTGSLDFGKKGIFNHKIEIPHAGLYRLIIIKGGKDSVVTATQSHGPVNVFLY